MSGLVDIKISYYVKECDIHVDRIDKAFIKIKHHFPFNEGKFNLLSDDIISLIDQFIYRIMKLQDTIGTRLIPALASVIIGNSDVRPFVDNLNTLKKSWSYTISRRMAGTKKR